MIKAVFLDIDGTLYSHTTNSIPSSALAAVNALKQKGIRIIAATGRHPWEISVMNMQEFVPDAWVYMNGAYCTDRDGTYYSEALDPQDLQTVLEEIRKDPFPCMFLTSSMIWINMDDPEVKKLQDEIHTPMPPLRDPEEAVKEPVYMMIPYVEADRWQRVFAGTSHLKYTSWNALAKDVFHVNTSKAEGIRRTLLHYGIRKEEALAAGDAVNDLPMAEACGCFTAMGNGSEEVKAAADFVTDSIDSNGLYKAFVHYGLLEEK